MNMSIKCSCSCDDGGPPYTGWNGAESSRVNMSSRMLHARPAESMGLVNYCTDLEQELIGPPLRVGEVYHLLPEDDTSSVNPKRFKLVTLQLYSNGLSITPAAPASGICPRSVNFGFTPFALVQACRLHSIEADTALSWLRIFKVSIFQHSSTHFFATHVNGEEGDAEIQRTRWVADISRTVRILTQSLFVDYVLRSDPLPGLSWTDTRLLAGYLALCDDRGVSLVYSELHCHINCAAVFAGYEDETCAVQVFRLSINMHTSISERVGVDCGCFSFDGYHFAARTCAEKIFWLRAISNVKVKLRHGTPDPTKQELQQYREAISEFAEKEGLNKRPTSTEAEFTRKPLLRRRDTGRKVSDCGNFVGLGWLSRDREHVEMVDTIGSGSLQLQNNAQRSPEMGLSDVSMSEIHVPAVVKPFAARPPPTVRPMTGASGPVASMPRPTLASSTVLDFLETVEASPPEPMPVSYSFVEDSDIEQSTGSTKSTARSKWSDMSLAEIKGDWSSRKSDPKQESESQPKTAEESESQPETAEARDDRDEGRVCDHKDSESQPRLVEDKLPKRRQVV